MVHPLAMQSLIMTTKSLSPIIMASYCQSKVIFCSFRRQYVKKISLRVHHLSNLGEKVVTDITANDGSWTFLCVTWKSQGGVWNVYKNGELVDQGENLSEDLSIEGNGVLILGQEQDTLGGGFSGSEAFKGKLYSFNFWNKYFSEADVNELMTNCKNGPVFESSRVISWADYREPSNRHGFIEIESVTICEGCSALSPPSHGYVRILSGSDRAHLEGNSKATISNSRAVYSCQEGYKLYLGDRVRTCGILGDWRGEQPICKCKFLHKNK